ncbi:hypothetical protein IAD21_03538 [Abditibacteriota bacterium]|nr:hypothetical protein IAD21_03538 [Abditibacteriota bacterium]
MYIWNDLHSPRLCLRRLRLEDATAIWTYRSLPEVARYQGWDSYTMEDAERLVTEQVEVVPDTLGSWLQLGIIERESETLIGDCGIHFPSEHPQQVMIGMTLSPTHQGRGLATETMESLLRYVLGRLNKHRAFAITDADNHASARLMERVGFRKEAHTIENVWFKGAWGSEFLFAMLRREWQTNCASLGQSLRGNENMGARN